MENSLHERTKLKFIEYKCLNVSRNVVRSPTLNVYNNFSSWIDDRSFEINSLLISELVGE